MTPAWISYFLRPLIILASAFMVSGPAMAQVTTSSTPPPFEGKWQLQVFWCESGGNKYEQLARSVHKHFNEQRDSGAWSFVRTDARGVTLAKIPVEEMSTLRTYPGQTGNFGWYADGLQVRWSAGEEDESTWLNNYLNERAFPASFRLEEVGTIFNQQLSVTICPRLTQQEDPPVLTGETAAALATRCADASGTDSEAFAACTGYRFVTSDQNSNKIIECIGEGNATSETLANCAGPSLLADVIPPDMQQTLTCARSSGGNTDAFVACMGADLQVRLSADAARAVDCVASEGTLPGAFAGCASRSLLSKALTPGQQKAVACAVEVPTDASAFRNCLGTALVNGQLSEEQSEVLSCASQTSGDTGEIIGCAGTAFLDRSLTKDQKDLLSCALASNGNESEAASCAAAQLLNGTLTQDQQAVLTCAASSGGDAAVFSSCAGQALLGANLPPEQKAAIDCAVQSQGDPTGFGTCAATKFLDLGLNPEQQIALQCVAQTAGQPYAAVACSTTRLLVRELEKCVTNGVGGDGCFGDSNDLVGKDGFVARSVGNVISDVTHGPGDSNDVVGKNGWLRTTFGL